MLDFANRKTLDIKGSIDEIEQFDIELEKRYKGKFAIQPSLTRPIVSFQANKTRPVYRWYKYKEGFSATLIGYLLNRYGVTKGKLLDPFAGSGTALFAASELGLDADGIELLPIGQCIINTKRLLDTELTNTDFETLNSWVKFEVWKHNKTRIPILELRITRGAYPEVTRESIWGRMDLMDTKVR